MAICAEEIAADQSPFVPKKLLQINRQDMVFIRPPGISDCAFQLRMGNNWLRLELQALQCLEMGNDSAWQCRRVRQVCYPVCPSG
jgi:hypothetical protein